MSAVLKAAPQPLSALHPDERAARVQLAACYRVFASLGWTELIYNHITLRVPDSVAGGERQFLINPFGLHYSEVTASNLVKIDSHGRVLDGSAHPVNPAGFTVHAAIHEGLPGAHCVMHTHTTAGMAVACLQGGLQAEQFLQCPDARPGGVPRLRGHHHPCRRRAAPAGEHRPINRR
jgi:ribulose-5-phosphate 4-epimerase/fuculose-1-phosphate aldolase